MIPRLSPPLCGLMLALAFPSGSHWAAEPTKVTPHVFCGTGDNLYVHKVEPVDSEATLSAMLEWMKDTYGVKRLYWRGAQENMWRKHYRMADRETASGRSNLTTDWLRWTHYLYGDQDLNGIVVREAKKRGMEVFFYTGLFEHGVQPDVGIIHPHMFEDTLRIAHPEWAPLDRWGQRRAPGPLCFSHPEARKALVDRYTDEIVNGGYDGVNFYTYVENIGIRYEEEFGFNPLVVEEFKTRYPDVNLEKDVLTPEQSAFLSEIRGRFVTQFLTELRASLAPRGKKISMILDATEPEYPQHWWGKKLRGTGKIDLDYKQWIEKGLVDEIWVQLAPVADQKKLLDQLLPLVAGKPVKLTVRTVNPFAPDWLPYVEKGVTPVAVITWEKNGIERISLEPTSLAALKSPDWKLRAQTLKDIADGQLPGGIDDVAPLVSDPQVLVRHRAMQALGAIGGERATQLLEAALGDSESSVRIAACAMLGKLRQASSAGPILAALEKGERFQFKQTAAVALSGMKPDAIPAVLEGLRSPSRDVREVAIRALANLQTPETRGEIFGAFRKLMLDPDEDIVVRSWAILRLPGNPTAVHDGLTEDLIALTGPGNPPKIQTDAAVALQALASRLDPKQKQAALEALSVLFREYGDDCERPDAAFGWRLVGNTMLSLGGKDILKKFREQKEDRWLAWNAYETEFLFQDLVIVDRKYVFNEVTEADAIANHQKYAPPFPGWRKW